MSKIPTPPQLALRLEQPTLGSLPGVEMGVTSDGTPFLTQRGVATVCGVAPSVITQHADELVGGRSLTPRAETLRALLIDAAHTGPLSAPAS